MLRRACPVLYAVLSLLMACKDPAEPILDRCIQYEREKYLQAALEACEMAARVDPTSNAGRLATGKVGVLREKLDAQHAWEEGQRLAQEKEAARRARASKVGKGGWRLLERPTTPVERSEYMVDVTTAFEGEPPLDPPKAKAIMDKVRSELARMAGVNISQVIVGVDATSGSIEVAKGVLALVGNSPRNATEVGVCSEVFLGAALQRIKEEDFSMAGLRGLSCNSTNCSAVFDLRPERPEGGGLYDGTACLGLVEMIDKAYRR